MGSFLLQLLLASTITLVTAVHFTWSMLASGAFSSVRLYLVLAFLVFMMSLLVLINRLFRKYRPWWVYLLTILIYASMIGLTGLEEKSDHFEFIKPGPTRPGEFPQEYLGPSSLVKLSLNHESRKAVVLDRSFTIRTDSPLPENAHLIIGIGVIRGQGDIPEVSVSVHSQGIASEEVGRWTLNSERSEWFDRVVDLSEWAGREAAVTITDLRSSDPDKTKQYPLFLGPARFFVRDKNRPRPNLVLVVVDSLRYDALTNEPGKGHTPLLHKRIEKGGLVFKRHYSQSSWTSASIASMFTSKMPIQTGVVSLYTATLPETAETFAGKVKKAGYVTGAISANHLVSPLFNYDQGMDSMKLVTISNDLDSPQGYFWSADLVGDEAAEWIETHKDVPFMLYLHYMDPHYPYWPPPEHMLEATLDNGLHKTLKSVPALLWSYRSPSNYLDRDNADTYRNFYQQQVRYWDQSFDRLLTKIEALGLDQRTLVMVVSDHGEEFLEHGYIGHGHGLKEELIHVPFICLIPKAGYKREIDHVTSNLDIGPTISDYLGSPALPDALGNSLLPYLDNGESNKVVADKAWAELPVAKKHNKTGKYYRYQRVIVDENVKLIEKGAGQDRITTSEFYLISQDPGESDPLPYYNYESGKKAAHMLNYFFEELPEKTTVHPPISQEKVQRMMSLGYIKN